MTYIAKKYVLYEISIIAVWLKWLNRLDWLYWLNMLNWLNELKWFKGLKWLKL